MRTTLLLIASLGLALAACGDAAVELPQQLTILNVAPHHGATNVGIDVTIEIGFNDKLRRDTVDSQSLRLEWDGNPLEADRSLEADQRQVTLVTTADLIADTEYEIFVGPEVSGLNAGELGTAVRTRFRTLP